MPWNLCSRDGDKPVLSAHPAGGLYVLCVYRVLVHEYLCLYYGFFKKTNTTKIFSKSQIRRLILRRGGRAINASPVLTLAVVTAQYH
jgi:hypothetical protein